ncbi:MAG: DUF5723 family protein [Bacteroidetes bacterium]|nr:DUF5723 family protein [Bacteroidota bacterium]
MRGITHLWVGLQALFCIGFLTGGSAFGQEMLGVTLGNYSGVNGLQLNPSSLLSSKSYLSINLLAGDAFIQNNFIYMDKHEYKTTNFLRSGLELPVHNEQYGTELRNFYTYDNQSLRGVYTQIRINGPGAMIIIGKQAFAVTTGVRSVTSAKNVPYEIANFAYLGLNYVPQHNINYKDNRPFKVGQLTWAEIGISYACTFYSRNLDVITAGISIKRLFGYSGLYLKGNRADYIVPNDSTISVHNFNGQVGYSLPLDYDQNGFWNDKLFTGHGFSGDIGVTYTHLTNVYSEDYWTRLCTQHYNDYLYRIGVALIDVGAIRFNTHAEKYSIDDKSSYWDDVNRFHYQTIHQMMDTMSYKFYGDNTSAYRGNSFYMWLPSALSVQFDYHYSRNWYVNAALIYGFDLSPSSVSRPSQIAITPRYETRNFEANLPVSLYDWNKLRVGLSLRFYYLTIGTEKLGQFFRISNFTGLDFYFALNFFIAKGNCGNTRIKECTEVDYRLKSTYR